MTLGVLELTYLLPGQNSNNIKKVYGVVNELLCRKRSEKKPTGNDDNLVEKFSEFFVSKVEISDMPSKKDNMMIPLI